MKERPILFSAPMVRALLEGRKTQTRRVCSGQRERSCIHDFQLDLCPYGQPGDRLWVRETYFGNHFLHPHEPVNEREIHYRADGLPDFEGEECEIRWRPPIHMPRWASRILLEVTDVRVQRVQEISEADALAEGVDPTVYAEMNHLDGRTARWPSYSPRMAFLLLWDSINAKRGYDWEANPWVWAITFQHIKVNA